MGKKIEINPKDKSSGHLHSLFRTRREWKEFVVKMKEIHNGTCDICGRDIIRCQCHIHHRIRDKFMGQYMNLDPNRFLVLCSPCHDWVHKACSTPNFKDLNFYYRNHEEEKEFGL